MYLTEETLYFRMKLSKLDYQQKLKKELEFLRAQNPFRDVDDPVEWQRQQRKNRELPR